MRDILQQIDALMQAHKMDSAEALCVDLVEDHPDRVEGWLHLGWISQLKTNADKMLECGESACVIDPRSIAALMLIVEGAMGSGQMNRAKEALLQIEGLGGKDAKLWSHIAKLNTNAGAFEAAGRCYDIAYEILGDDPDALYNCAAAQLALGNMDKAEAFYNRVLDLKPSDTDVYYNRATLRKQTQDKNHIDEIESFIKRTNLTTDLIVPAYYALAKENEDLGNYKQSIEALIKGANARSSLLQYDVQADVTTMHQVANTMCAFEDNDTAATDHHDGRIFILGLPRSGTTLVERMLVSHKSTESLGELTDLVVALTKTIGKVSDKEDLIIRSPQMDYSEMGQYYMSSTAQRSLTDATILIDKTPANFLYIGWIALAIPNAKIIHLRRNPMDSCYAMYKTLFRMGYPFSYTLEDLGAYYVAYHDLMAHWRRELPGRILDVDYESLVAEPEVQSQRIFAHSGLEWDASVLDFHKSKAPVATASAAQVRQPIYKSSVGKWRHYERELAPLKAILNNAGIKT